MPDPTDMSRYSRQMLLVEVGEGGQRRLRESHAAIVGCGALGCAIADHLARAGVGTLTLIDRDIVELSNLQRQALFDERDAAEAMPKAEAARRRLEAVNSDVRVRAIVGDLHAGNAERIFRNSDQWTVDSGKPESRGVSPSRGSDGHYRRRGDSTVHCFLDGSDNFETRYLLNDLSVKHGVPLVYGGVVGTRGMQATFVPGKTACLRCLFELPPAPGSTPTCDTAGVLGPAVGIVGACQAADAIKIMLGREDLLSGTLLEFDVWTNSRRRIELAGPRPECPCCGARRFEYLDASLASDAVSLCGQGAFQVRPSGGVALALPDLQARLARVGEFVLTRFHLRGRIRDDGIELTVFPDGRAIIKGVTTPDRAKGVYARYVGA